MKMTPGLEVLIEHAYRSIENEPEYLLEHDGGPGNMGADIIVARLIGLDGEVVDQFFLRDALPVWRVPVWEPAMFMAADEPVTYEPMRTVDFRLQSNYAVAELDPMYAPEGATRNPHTLRTKVLCLRYRREPIHSSR